MSDEINARTYRCATQCVLSREDLALYMLRWSLPGETEVRMGNPVPVFGLSNAPIGFGYCAWAGDKLGAELDLDYHTDERLRIETEDPLYAWFALVRHDPAGEPSYLVLDHLVLNPLPPPGGERIVAAPSEGG